MKAVFDTKANSGYGDKLPELYHFPVAKYRAVAEAALGDWVLYREVRDNHGRQAYIGVGRLAALEPDPSDRTQAYAHITDYVPFEPPVAFGGAPQGYYWEEPLRALPDRSLVGASLRGRSMRSLSDFDFAAIVAAGLGETLKPEHLVRYGPGMAEQDQMQITGYPGPADDAFVRRIEQALVNRKVRDANFRRLVCQAYDDTCAVTGLRIINGGGRSEVQAAHIWSVESGGPDVVQNGIALSGTVHWLFDRHLISLSDDYRLLVAHNRVPAELRTLFQNQMEQIRLPRDQRAWPSRKYIERHRERFAGYA